MGLTRYCIRCEDVGQLMGGQRKGSPSTRLNLNQVSGTTASTLPSYDQDESSRAGFVIGDEEDDEEMKKGEEREVIPPSYDTATSSNSMIDDPIPIDKNRTPLPQCSLHYLQPGETLSGLALKYRIDVSSRSSISVVAHRSVSKVESTNDAQGHTLARLNKLPISTLSTTPQLAYALPFLLLPPGANSMSSTPLLSPYEEHRRLTLRRFSVATSCSDYAMAKVYVDAVFDQRAKEVEQITANRKARGDDSIVEVRMGGEVDEAIESYNADEQFEKAQGRGKGKGKLLVAAKSKSSAWGW